MLFLTGLMLLLASGFLADTTCVRETEKPERVIAVSTNLPYDLTYIPGYGITSVPSLGIEYYPSGHKRFTAGLDFDCPFWAHRDTHRFLQANNLTLSGRWYFQKNYTGNYHGLFLYAGAGAARYGIGWDAKGWQGEGFHLSAGLGWKFSLGRNSRFFMDMGLAGGWFHSRYDPYVYGYDATGWYYYDYNGLPENFIKRNQALDWFGPTRVWLSIGVELFNRNKNHKTK